MGSTAETLSESVGLISNLKLERNEHSIINVAARKGGRLKTMLVQPHPHRAHLPRQIARIEAEFHGAHILQLGCCYEPPLYHYSWDSLDRAVNLTSLSQPG